MTTQKNFKVKKKRIWYKCKVWREYNTGTTLTWIWNFFIDKENNNPEIALKCHVNLCPGISKRVMFKEFPLRAPGLLYKLGLFPCDEQWLASSWRRSPISVSLLPCLEIGTLGFFLLDVSNYKLVIQATMKACYLPWEGQETDSQDECVSILITVQFCKGRGHLSEMIALELQFSTLKRKPT